MKSILTIFILLLGSVSWAQSNEGLFKCTDNTFSWDRIIVSEVGEKLSINLNSGYNQAFTVGFFKPERKSGSGQITLDKNACNIQGNTMVCTDTELEISLRLHSQGDEDLVTINDTIKGSIVLSEIIKKSIGFDGKPISSRSAELAFRIPWDSNPENISDVAIQVPCIREAFEGL